MANLTNYMFRSEESAIEDLIHFDYKVVGNNMCMFSNPSYLLIEQKYGVPLYSNCHHSIEIKDFISRYKKARFNQCLPLRFLRTLLQTFYVKPVGWLKTNLGTGER